MSRHAAALAALAALVACGGAPAPKAEPKPSPRAADVPYQVTPDPRVKPEEPGSAPQVTGELVAKYVKGHRAYLAGLPAIVDEVRKAKGIPADAPDKLAADPEFRTKAEALAKKTVADAGLTEAEEKKVLEMVQAIMPARTLGKQSKLDGPEREKLNLAVEAQLATARRRWGDAQVDAILAHEAELATMPGELGKILGLKPRG